MAEWYYADGTEQIGPVTASEIRALLDEGRIHADTLVWQPGMTDWTPVAQIDPSAFDAHEGADEPALPPFADIGPDVCSVCKRPFSEESLLRYQDMQICPECKPVFFQRLRESGDPSLLTLGGFFQRALAKIIDSIILSLPIFGYIFYLAMAPGTDFENIFVYTPFDIFFNLFYYVFNGAYTIFFLGRFGATPGKMVMGLKVVRADGNAITYGRATGRFFGEVVSGFICYLGYFIAAFDEQRRTLHDHMCDTRVIRK